MHSSKKKSNDMSRQFDLYASIKESQLWGNIHRAAKTNATLADALDKVKMIYALIKKENN